MNFTHKLLSLTSTLGALCCAGAEHPLQQLERQSSKDPLALTRQVYAAEAIQSIYRAESDLNNDGKAEIQLGLVFKQENGEIDTQDQKPVWLIYIAQADQNYRVAVQNDQQGKERVEVLSFDKKYLTVGLIPELKRHGLLFLEAGDQPEDDCQLMAIVLENKQWKQIPVGAKGKVATHLKQMQQRFEKPLELKKL